MHQIDPGKQIFVVDDDAAVCDCLRIVFTVEAYRVATFRDGASFLAAARMQSPACVLLDVYMPGGSGLDILDELNAINYPAPIFMMSGRGDIPTAVKAVKCGAFDFIEKPFAADAVAARVRGAINAWAGSHSQDEVGSVPHWFPGCDRLTPREREVLSWVATAASNEETAKALGISRRTVEIHRIRMMQKLGARNSVDLIRIVLGRGAALRSPQARVGVRPIRDPG